MNEPDEQLLSLAARGQKIVIYSILLNFIVGAMDRSQAVPAWVVQALFLGTAVLALRGVIGICSGLSKSQNYKLLMMVLTFVPLVNLVSLIYLSVRVTRSLRAAGYEVGLLGVKL